jgi:ABC-type multidrug transport system permease subunit
MDEEPRRPDGDDEYPLAPPEPRPALSRPLTYGILREESPAEAEEDHRRWQFSLSEMLWMMAGSSVILSLLGCLPGGYSAKAFAALAGLIVMVSFLVLELLKPERMIFYIGWWLGFLAYIASSVVAIAIGD